MTDAVVARIVDGDTLDVTFTGPVRIRLADVDAPEMGTDAGAAAKAYMEALLPVGSTVEVELRTEDPHGRPVGHVRINGATRMIETGHARRWTR